MKASSSNNIFVLFSKFAEDEWVVKLKLSEKSHLKLCQWADLVSVHALPGPGALSALRELNASSKRQIGALIVSDMQTKVRMEKKIDPPFWDQCLFFLLTL